MRIRHCHVSFAYLKKRGWYDNSLLIVVGDHGEGLGEHDEDLTVSFCMTQPRASH